MKGFGHWLSDNSQVVRVSVLLLLGGAATLLWVATPWLIQPYPQDVEWFASPGLFPRAALGIMALASFGEILRHRRGISGANADELDAHAVDPLMAVQLLLAFALYAAAVPALGYLVSSLLFLASCGRIVRLSWRTSLILSGVLAFVMWLVFAYFLEVAFGHGWLL